MTELADIVAAIYEPDPRFRSLQVTGTEWLNHPRLLAAFLRDVPAGAPLLTGTSMEERPEEGVDTWRAWVQPPDRTKVQFVVGDETVTAVFHADTWWSWSPPRGGLTNGGRPHKYHGRGPAEVMISPAGVLPCLQLELLGQTTALSRRVCRLPAVPVAADNFSLHDLGKGADDYGLVVDAKLGLLRRVEAGVLTLNYLATTREGRTYVVSFLGENPNAPIEQTRAEIAVLSAIRGAFELVAKTA